MRKLLVFLGLLVSTSCFAADQTPVTKKQSRYLTAEDAALAEAKRWQASGEARPFLSDDGMVLYPFGQYLPTMTCSTIHACDIQLEAGEQVVDKPKTGDIARWSISKMVSGPSDAEVVHVVVKPLVEGVETNLIIPTDRRVYQVRLRSSAKEGGQYIHRMGFYYPEDMVAKWGRDSEKERRKAEDRERATVSSLGPSSIEDFDFAYTIEGDAPFKPTRVFSNGKKTYIQMPASVRRNEAPALVVLDEQGQPIMVNYRVKQPNCMPDCAGTQGDIIEVDQIVRQAMLVLGSDDSVRKITIKKKGSSSGFGGGNFSQMWGG